MTTVAHFPPQSDAPYLVCLRAALTRCGVKTPPTPRLSFSWLWANRGRVGALHFHWPSTHYETGRHGPLRSGLLRGVALALFLIKLRLAKALGYQLIWTAHNVLPHGPHKGLYRAERWLTCHWAWDRVIAHCPAAAEAVRGLGFSGEVKVLPHGHFLDLFPPTGDRIGARERLGLAPDAFVTLHFGAIRPYKGIEELIDAFLKVARPIDVLVIAGGGDTGTVQTLRARAGGDPRIRWMPERVPDAAVAELFEAADCVALPYRRVTTSGNLVLAMGFGKPVVVPASGCIPHMVTPDFAATYNPGDESGLMDALVAVRGLDPVADSARERARGWDWDAIAAETANLYGAP